ncbi:MAG: hypothetical protein H7Z37_06425 [Pyrinomonadaceae bacterium]|nr:hypothetical protein [Pyrinomonadaceae bacterium]
MTKLFVYTFFAVLLFGASANAQTRRVQDLADKLAQQSDNLAQRAFSDFRGRYDNSRNDVDNLMLAQQTSAAANTFQRLVQDRRKDSELRDVAAYLQNLVRRSSGSNWREVQQTANDIGREFQVGNNGNGGNGGNGGNNDRNEDNRDVIGRVRWRGSVDDEVQLTIRDNSLEVRTISGTDYGQGNTNFTSPLPNRRVNVEAAKKKGRGNVRVLQQPSRDNNFTTVIQILDKSGGAKDYDVDVYWTR